MIWILEFPPIHNNQKEISKERKLPDFSPIVEDCSDEDYVYQPGGKKKNQVKSSPIKFTNYLEMKHQEIIKRNRESAERVCKV